MLKREEAIEHLKEALLEFENKKILHNKRKLSRMEESVIEKIEKVLNFLES